MIVRNGQNRSSRKNECVSLFDFIDKCGNPLKSLFPQFQKDFVAIFNRVKKWECDNVNGYDYLLDGIPEDEKLEYFLPSKQGDGVISMALWNGREGDKDGDWQGLPTVQNAMYSKLHLGDKPPAISAYNLTESDVILVDYQQILQLVNALFTVPGYHPSLSKDLVVIESLCKYGNPKLASFPYIVPRLPEFEYGLDGVLELIANLRLNLERRTAATISWFVIS